MSLEDQGELLGMPRPRHRSKFPTVLVAPWLLGVCGACGASYQAVYEGDVRFEHCMALDEQPDVKPTIRRACWSEWVAFYTYGQTRDRVGHAMTRIRRLSGIREDGGEVEAKDGGEVEATDER